MAARTWDPETYPTTIRDEIHDYDELQEQVARATADLAPRTILDVGVGSGETAARVLERHPAARLVGVDSSPDMLRAAADRLPSERVVLVEQRLDEPLPDGPFDVVVSALAIHHLEGGSKRTLFRATAARLDARGRLVIGDVVVPDDPADALIENEPGYDFPSTVADQLAWLHGAGFTAEVAWVRNDLAVLVAQVAARGPPETTRCSPGRAAWTR